MKSTIAVLSILTVISSMCLAQSDQFPDRFNQTQSAAVIPNLSLYLSGGTNVMSPASQVFRGEAKLGIADALELGLNRREASVDFLGVARFVTQLEFKLRILQGTDALPSVAIAYNTSLDWSREELWQQDIQSVRPAYAAQGLNGSRFDYALSTAQVIISQPVVSGLAASAGIGVQEVRYQNVWLFIDPAPYRSNGLTAPAAGRELMFTGFLQADAPISHTITLFAEAQTLPAMSPMMDRAGLIFIRVYQGTVGVRYSPMPMFAFDAMVTQRSAFLDIAQTEVRIGLSTIMDLSRFVK